MTEGESVFYFDANVASFTTSTGSEKDFLNWYKKTWQDALNLFRSFYGNVLVRLGNIIGEASKDGKHYDWLNSLKMSVCFTEFKLISNWQKHTYTNSHLFTTGISCRDFKNGT